MSLLDDARRLAEQDEPDENFEHGGRRYFVFCGRMVTQGHAPDCSWLALPKIVAALEAAELMVKTHETHEYPGYWGAMQRGVRMYREAEAGEVLTR